MPLKFEPPQKHNQVRNHDSENGRLGRIRSMSMYIMIFLSMASPMLYESSLIAWYIDLFSTLIFMAIVIWTHPEEIKKFGPVVFPTAGLLSVVIFASHVSLLESIPWVPFAISLWLLVTVYSCPVLLSLAQEVLQVSRQDLSKHGHYLRNPARDVEEYQEQAPIFSPNQTELPKSISRSELNRDLAFMGRPASVISTNPSDIDLDEGNSIGKFVAARFLSHFREEDAGSMEFSNQVRSHSQDIPMHCPDAPEDSLVGHYSTTGSIIYDHI